MSKPYRGGSGGGGGRRKTEKPMDLNQMERGGDERRGGGGYRGRGNPGRGRGGGGQSRQQGTYGQLRQEQAGPSYEQEQHEYQGQARRREYQGQSSQQEQQGQLLAQGYQGQPRQGYQGQPRGQGGEGQSRGQGYQGPSRGQGYRGKTRGQGYQGGSDRQSRDQGGNDGQSRGRGYQGQSRGQGYRGSSRGRGYQHQGHSRDQDESYYPEQNVLKQEYGFTPYYDHGPKPLKTAEEEAMYQALYRYRLADGDFPCEEYDAYYEEMKSKEPKILGDIDLPINYEQMLEDYPFEAIVMDAGVKRWVRRFGKDDDVPPEDCDVIIHYRMMLEKSVVPIFQTERDKPLRFSRKHETIMPWLDHFVGDMNRGEVAYFLVKPEFGYGNHGVYGVVPKGSRVLYEIEMVDFIETQPKPSHRVIDLSEDQLKKFGFLKLQHYISILRHHARFDNGIRKYEEAAVKYERAIRVLQAFETTNPTLQFIVEKWIFEFLLDASLCHIDYRDYDGAKTMCEAMLAMDEHLVPQNLGLVYFRLSICEYQNEFVELGYDIMCKANRLMPSHKEIAGYKFDMWREVYQLQQTRLAEEKLKAEGGTDAKDAKGDGEDGGKDVDGEMSKKKVKGGKFGGKDIDGEIDKKKVKEEKGAKFGAKGGKEDDGDEDGKFYDAEDEEEEDDQ